MTLTGKPVKQERNVNTKQINQRIPQYLYLLRSHRSNDEPASQNSGNEQVRSKRKPWRWSPPYNMRTWTTNNTNLPWCKENASTSEKSATSERNGNRGTALRNYSELPESSELLLTIRSQNSANKKHRNKSTRIKSIHNTPNLYVQIQQFHTPSWSPQSKNFLQETNSKH